MKLVHAPGATPLDPDELAGLLPNGISTQGELNALEQANISDAERWALGRRRDGVLQETFLRKLHRHMFDQVWAWAGKYRLSDKNIGVPWATIAVATRELCANAQYWIEHGSYSWPELGARFHHRLVQIHPFANGNGRHARLMTDVILHGHGQELFSWGSGDLLAMGGARARYIAALRAADGNDFQPLLAFVRS